MYNAIQRVCTPTLLQARYFAGVVDTIALWLSTSNLFCLWTICALRPPLYLALPAQLFALGRLTAADFCQAPVRRPAVLIRQRVVVVGLSMLPSLNEAQCSGLQRAAGCWVGRRTLFSWSVHSMHGRRRCATAGC